MAVHIWNLKQGEVRGAWPWDYWELRCNTFKTAWQFKKYRQAFKYLFMRNFSYITKK